MFSVGDLVRLRAPFDLGHEGAAFTVEAVQFVAEDGSISELPTLRVQYLLSGGGFENVAFAAENVEPS